MKKPLDGILVVALEQAVAAPLCTCRLADAGARVIKIERAEGDFARGYDRAVHGESAYFVWLNRGKESIVLDLAGAADAALLHRMIARADVFIENLAPGRVGISAADIGTGLNAHAAILEALLARERSGEGRAISVALFDTIAEWMAVPLLQFQYGGKAPARVGLNHPSIAPYGVYAVGDGSEILIAIQNEREWASFRDRILDGTADPRFADNPARVAHRTALDAAIRAAFARYDGPALRLALDAAGIAYGALNDVAGLAAHPHLAQVTVDSPAGPIALPRPPARTGGPAPAYGAVPALGEHGARLREEFS